MKRTPFIKVALAFLVVAVPLAWGFYRSVRNSKPLFTAGSPAAPAPPAATK
jgi:hypothetical protein